jgi:putative ABC transport system substrate-binding protein
VLNAASEDAIDASFETMNRDKAGAVVVASTAFFFSRRKQLIVLAARHAIPAIYQLREFTTDGGLMSYGASAAKALGVTVSNAMQLLADEVIE